MILEIDSSQYNNIYVCGDIHGCYNLLIEKLEDLNFNFDTDLLIAVGDLVDRGPQSFKCLNLVNEKWFRSVKGNHEDFIEWIHETDSDITSLHISNGGSWYYQLSEEDQKYCYNLVKTLPYIINLNINNKNIAIIHAEFPKNFVNWNDAHMDLQRYSFKETLLWGRTRIEKNLQNIVTNIDEIYCGHTVVKEPVKLGNHNYIDTGAFHYNNLTILKIK